jgi:hypothetical protein
MEMPSLAIRLERGVRHSVLLRQCSGSSQKNCKIKQCLDVKTRASGGFAFEAKVRSFLLPTDGAIGLRTSHRRWRRRSGAAFLDQYRVVARAHA